MAKQKARWTRDHEATRIVLTACRMEAKLTQREFAKKLDRSHSFVARIENGEYAVKVTDIYLIARVLGIPAMSIFKRIDTWNETPAAARK